MDQADRARRHAALGDPIRLHIVDLLVGSDLTPGEIATRVGVGSNLLAHHLDVLDDAGLIERRSSEGDRRRRYLRLRWDALGGLATPRWAHPAGRVLFVCTHNSARSQFAAAMWRMRTAAPTESAGSHPAPSVPPGAVRAAAELGVDLSAAVPRGYDQVEKIADLVISVCDKARETTIPFDAPRVHWSVTDPVARGRLGDFRAAFGEIAERIDHALAAAP